MGLDKDMIDFVNSGGEKNPFDKPAEEFISDPESLDKVLDRDLLEEMRGYQDEITKVHGKLHDLVKVAVPINRHGLCPNCNISWDGGDILEELSRMDVFQHRSRAEMLKIAAEYGYDEENKKRFSNITMVEITPSFTFSDLQLTQLGTGASIQVPLSYYQCPSCHHVFDTKTGKHFNSLNEARNNVYE